MRTVTEIDNYLKSLNWGSGMGVKAFPKPCDPIYSTPTEEFILGPAIAAYEANLRARGLEVSYDNFNDCDKHAVRFYTDVHDAHAKTQIKLMKENPDGFVPSGFAIGFFSYINFHAWPREGHMACFALTETPSGLSCIFIEAVPQRGLGKFVPIDREIESIDFRFY